MSDPLEIEARHYLREVLISVIEKVAPSTDAWAVADALLDDGEITWDYRIVPEPQVAEFRLIFAATDVPAGESTPEVTE